MSLLMFLSYYPDIMLNVAKFLNYKYLHTILESKYFINNKDDIWNYVVNDKITTYLPKMVHNDTDYWKFKDKNSNLKWRMIHYSLKGKLQYIKVLLNKNVSLHSWSLLYNVFSTDPKYGGEQIYNFCALGYSILREYYHMIDFLIEKDYHISHTIQHYIIQSATSLKMFLYVKDKFNYDIYNLSDDALIDCIIKSIIYESVDVLRILLNIINIKDDFKICTKKHHEFKALIYQFQDNKCTEILFQCQHFTKYFLYFDYLKYLISREEYNISNKVKTLDDLRLTWQKNNVFALLLNNDVSKDKLRAILITMNKEVPKLMRLFVTYDNDNFTVEQMILSITMFVYIENIVNNKIDYIIKNFPLLQTDKNMDVFLTSVQNYGVA